jgi:hypothetical protein
MDRLFLCFFFSFWQIPGYPSSTLIHFWLYLQTSIISMERIITFWLAMKQIVEHSMQQDRIRKRN